MCNKVDARIECEECGYPLSEADFPDDYDDPLPCDADLNTVNMHIARIRSLRDTWRDHYWDCKCLICR